MAMESENTFVMQKNVNWSFLNEGLTIPVSVYEQFRQWDASVLEHGKSKPIKILIDGELFDATLKNLNFNRLKYPGHQDIIQIRYSPNSSIATKLKACFQKSFEYLYVQRKLEENQRRKISLPDDIKESVRLYLTVDSNVLAMECSTDSEYHQLANVLKAVPEEIYEVTDDDRFFLADKTASIEEKERLVKYRKIDRTIIRMLKEYYDYRDEITGEKVGDRYGESVIEAHHIDYFTKSQNNDSTNIIIISPNYHRIIHKNNPHFNRRKYQFEFENGEVLKLKLYEHLKMASVHT